MTSDLIDLPANRVVLLRNGVCPYCGCNITKENKTKEHVVGRRFVPKGTLEASWNLILQACSKCNAYKANLEDDISSISLIRDTFGIGDELKGSVRDDVNIKIKKSISRLTRKAVINSFTESNFLYSISSCVNVNVNMLGPPAMSNDRAFELARMQLIGLFFFITYDESSGCGYWWTGDFHPLMLVRRGDWGNSFLMDFKNAIQEWEPRLICDTAHGFYRVIIRRYPAAECWAWALEWNKSVRLVGFFGDSSIVESTVNGFRKLKFTKTKLKNGDFIKKRLEVPLNEENDDIFTIK